MFQDLGEGILENALQVAIIYLTGVSFTYITELSVFLFFLPPSSMFSNNSEILEVF